MPLSTTGSHFNRVWLVVHEPSATLTMAHCLPPGEWFVNSSSACWGGGWGGGLPNWIGDRCASLCMCVYVCMYVCVSIHACVYVCSHPHPPTLKKVHLSLASWPVLPSCCCCCLGLPSLQLLSSLLLLELFFYMSAPIAMQEVCLLGVYMEMYMCDTSIQTHRSTSPIVNIKKTCRALFCAPSGSCITLLSFLLTLWLFIL